MQRLIARTLTIVSLAVMLLAGEAYGQYVQHIVKLNAPFEFNVNNKTFAAGEYSIVWFAPRRLELRDSRGRVLTSLIAHPVEARRNSTATRLDFSTADGAPALRQIWFAETRVGYELFPAKLQTSIANKSPQSSAHAGGAGNK
jgi:hypothetical protein